MLRLIAKCAAALCALLLLTSCGGGGSTSSVNIYLADAPIDAASSVNISLTEIDITGDAGTSYFQAPATTLNFYQLQGGLSQFLLAADVSAGHYSSITLHFAAAPGTTDSNITFIGGNTYPLVIPSGAPTAFTLPVNFYLTQNGTANYTIDLDLRKSIIPDPTNPGQYILQPSLRVVSNAEAGSISGSVANTLVTSGCAGAVYVYSGKVTPTDVNINAPPGTVQPISSALVGINSTTAQYNFTVGWLPPGLYTVAFTCQAAEDNPTQTDNISFTSVLTTTVAAGQTSFVSLN
ncbi:MAG: DUF4382 domain-containing protein [Gammaproteobacteria bacterium]